MPYRLRATRSSAFLTLSVGLLLTGAASAQTPAPSQDLPPLPPTPPAAPADTAAAPPAAPTAPPQPPVVPAESPPETETERSPEGSPNDAVSPGNSFDDVRYRDAHADRVILGSTAETHPAGTLFMTDYEIALLQLGYAITDDVQIAVAGVPPIAKDQDYFLDLDIKANLVRTASFRAAIMGAFDIVTDSGSSDGPFLAGRFGAVGQFCFDDRCRSSLSINAGLAAANDTDHTLPAYGSLGLIVNVSPLVSLLAEPAIGGGISTNGSSGNGGALLVFDYGLRIAGPRFGVDLTFVEPLAITSGDFDNPLILGYPFVAFTYRTEGTVHVPAVAAMVGR